MIRDRSRLDNIQPVMSVTAVELEKAYTADQTTADEQFKGKFITVSGRIEDIGKDMVGKFLSRSKRNAKVAAFSVFSTRRTSTKS